MDKKCIYIFTAYPVWQPSEIISLYYFPWTQRIPEILTPLVLTSVAFSMARDCIWKVNNSEHLCKVALEGLESIACRFFSISALISSPLQIKWIFVLIVRRFMLYALNWHCRLWSPVQNKQASKKTKPHSHTHPRPHWERAIISALELIDPLTLLNLFMTPSN